MITPILSEKGLDLSSNGKHRRKRIHRARSEILRLFLSNLEETCLVPEQLSDYDGSKPQPEKDMWFSVLEDAIGCYINKDATSRIKMRLANEAKEWFSSHEYFRGTFLWVCAVLGLNDGYIRQGVEKLRQKEERVYKREQRLRPDLLGEELFPAEKIIACVRSFHKIELCRGLSYNALRMNNLGCWRQLFAYALRVLSKPKLSRDDIAKVLECSHKTAINLYYSAIHTCKKGDKQFMSAAEEFKNRLKNMEATEAEEVNERSLQ